MSDDESSFVILGSTPTPSMEQYNGHEHSMAKESGSITSNVMQSSTPTMQNFSLVSSLLMNSPSLSAAHTDNLNGDSPVNSVAVNEGNPLTQSMMKAPTASGNDFAEQFLMGEIPADSLKYNIWKHFPSFCTTQSNPEDIERLEGFINEHVKLKENLQKTNEAMRQHFSTIDKWQTRVKELKETQASEIAECNEQNASLKEQLRLKVVENENLHVALLERDEFNQKLKMEIARIKEEHEEKTMQFNMNLAFAAGENNDLVQDISAKNAIIQNMTNMIEKLEKQLVSFEMVSLQRDGDRNKSESSLMNKSQSAPKQESPNPSLQESHSSSMGRSQSSSMDGSQSSNGSSSTKRSTTSALNSVCNLTDFATQLSAARQQNLQLLEDVSNKIVTIKRLESESSKLQHQLLSLEMIVNENGQNASEDREKVRQLKDEINQISIQNIQIREVVQNEYVQQIDQLKESLVREQERYQKLKSDNDKWIMEFDLQRLKVTELTDKVTERQNDLAELTAKNAEQQTELTEMQKAIVLLRSKEINADIQAHQKEQEFAEIKEENEFLKAQLDVYKSDFEMERQSRQDIANEREELLSDLKLLQRRNQQLIEEAQSRLSNGASTSSSTASAPPQASAMENRKPVGKFICPVCNNSSSSLMALQNHVQSCLEN
ncbi:NF-kappa-B essential modulator isoform X2 [Bradysia coprophila]|uniref:NF-kappa-B essential modulator isoform X2 n=1 Tax=Bradysia coprophila TaxID=38358 RepID=UPI00187D7C9A|nr:NF-kappa-B essential modulator isoform X2 [Bradysia coprophila]